MASNEAGVAQVDFTVKFGRETVSFTLPLFTCHVSAVKAILFQRTQVPIEKQRLFFNNPVVKDYRRDAADSTPLSDLFPTALVEGVSCGGQHTATQHIKVGAMLLGSHAAAPMIDSKATSEITRLVSTTVEHDGQWFRCCYGKGYVRQTAYVCRTCVVEGRADPAHAVCLACAEICHGNHEVEEWGVRYFMRCDCCTEKCWRQLPEGSPGDVAAKLRKAVAAPEPVPVSTMGVEQRTKRKRSRSSSPLTPKHTSMGGSLMSGIRVPAVANGPSPFSLNDPPPSLPSAEAAPLSLGVEQKKEGNGVSVTAAVSDAADTDGSPPTRYPEPSRCVFLLDSKTGKPPENAVIPTNRKNRYPRRSLTWCYCEVDNPTDDPECGGIVCILCTSCYWSVHMTRLYTDQYRRMPCYGDVVQGELVAFKCLTCDTLVCTPCRLRCHKDHEVEPGMIIPSPEDGTDNGAPAGAKFSCGCRGHCSIAEVVPPEELADPSTYMDMPPDVAAEVMNSDVFMGLVCGLCMQEYPWLVTADPAKCYEGKLPTKVTEGIKPIAACANTDPIELIPEKVYPYHGMLLPVNTFTAESTCNCEPCRESYEAFAPRADEDATEMVICLHDYCDNCSASLKDEQAFMCKTCELTLESTFFLCKSCNTRREALVQARQPTLRPRMEGRGGTASPLPRPATPVPSDPANRYEHDLSHEFLEDTFENLYALCHMQILENLDHPTQEYLQEHWEDVKNEFALANTLTNSFGQVPLTFDEEEITAMAEANLAREPRRSIPKNPLTDDDAANKP